MNNKIAFSLLALAFVFVSCKKEDPDTEQPVVTAFTINGEDHEAVGNAGDNLEVVLSFTDNKALKEYKLDIHDNFDLHSHGKTFANLPYSSQTIAGISGTSDQVTLTLPIGGDVASGPYHADLSVLDEEGNQSDFSEIELHINRSDMAQIDLTAPSFATEPHYNVGDTVHLVGEITDETDIQEIVISLAEAEDHTHGKVSTGEIYMQDWDLTGSSDTNWNFSTLATEGKEIIIPSTVTLGDYELQIYVKDSDDNYHLWKGGLHIQ